MTDSVDDNISSSATTAPFILVLVIVILSSSVLLLGYRQDRGENTDSFIPRRHEDVSRARQVPFVIVGKEPSWLDLPRAVEAYRKDASRILHGLSRSLEVARLSERELFGRHDNGCLSLSIQKRIDELSQIFEHDQAALEKILQPFPAVLALPSDRCQSVSTLENGNSETEPSKQWAFFSNAAKDNGALSSYDSASQVVTHVARDWTCLGNHVRQSLYEWCISQVKTVCEKGSRILIPGAGLGRLAHDLAHNEYIVEANDSSVVMAAAAHSMLNKHSRGTLHPFSMDFFANEVDSNLRNQPVEFHGFDNDPQRGSLSYTVGDFVEAYSLQQSHDQFDSVVTCFFIDTATNVYEYISVIYSSLVYGGVWINVGPLHWHHNAIVRLSVNELKRLIIEAGFDIFIWSVDSEPINYRHEEPGSPKSTRYEAYRPLRFVVKRHKQRDRYY